ncbi:hypothetical protein [Pararhodobacter marinus]|uniref:hypothetical protein n=1 Tax=Pararhodobacter marinus TaxID=2184063 RepID=UPI0035143AB5
MAQRPFPRRVGIGLGVVFLIALTALAIAGPWLWRGTALRGADFTPEAWHAAWLCGGLEPESCAQRRGECRRGVMLESLLTGPLAQPGLNRESVATLLGAPNGQATINEGGRLRHCDIWRLGACSGIGDGIDALHVCFGPDGTLSSAGHIRLMQET